MPTNTQALIKKIQALPAERIAEVEDFVDFISLREHERAHARAAAAATRRLSPPSGTSRTTTPTMPFDFGDVVLVPFPFTSQVASKKRPAVVVSNGSYNRVKPDVMVWPSPANCDPAQVWVKSGLASGKSPASSGHRQSTRFLLPSNKCSSFASSEPSAPTIRQCCGRRSPRHSDRNSAAGAYAWPPRAEAPPRAAVITCRQKVR
jgi:hypothetical protein